MAQNTVQKSTKAPYGSWVSPLTAKSIFEGQDSIAYLSGGHDGLYFVESQASANGRSILLKLDNQHNVQVLTSSELSIRSRVHEYGGQPYLAVDDDLYYSNFTDQKIYKFSAGQDEGKDEGKAPKAITPDGLRYMEYIVDPVRGELIAVREDHRLSGEAVNTLVAIDMTEGGEGKVLYEGSDFVSSPTLSPDGSTVAFITWSHPNMPWDDTQLRIVRLDSEGGASQIVEIAGQVAIRSPAYASDGTLYFIADWTDWWVLYRLNKAGVPEKIFDQDVEMGSFAFENNQSAIISYARDGRAYLARVDLTSGAVEQLGQSFSSVGSVTRVGNRIYFCASTPSSKPAIYEVKGNDFERVYQPRGPVIDVDYLSIPEAICYPTGGGSEGASESSVDEQEQAYGFFYRPKNVDFIGPDGSLPPLIVKVHGGPVAETTSTLDPSIQFWTSRGFAVFDINHRGSTGYGRHFRKKLYPNWGLVDIEDVATGAGWLAQQALVDVEKLAIRGGSAGGYTVLAALAFQDVFKAGTSYYGVSDLEVLAQDTHKFESRYLDQLIGDYPAAQDIYRARSPIYAVDDIDVPLLLLQGLDDEIVPPNQSEMIFEALKLNGIPTAYIQFPGEGHGFRQPDNQMKALNAELSFYGQVFGFVPAGNLEPVQLTLSPSSD